MRYGRGSMPLDTSSFGGADIIEPRNAPSPPDHDIASLTIAAAASPIASAPLHELASAANDACIVVSDRTRKYCIPLWLPALLDSLNASGMPAEKITVLIANGTHPGHTEGQIRELIGDETASRVKVIDHDCDDAAGMVSLGVTASGTPIEINRIFAAASLKIVTGAVSHHYHAGFTGGRKGIVPGVASRRTAMAGHSLTLDPESGPHPRIGPGRLAGNPVHEDMLESARRAENVFLINFVCSAAGEPVSVFAGDLVIAHEHACRAAAEMFEAPISARYDTVLASCGGSPYDINFYQAHKSLHNAFQAVRPGGRIVLLAECPDDLGPPEFAQFASLADTGEIETRLRLQHSIPGFTAYSTLTKTSAADVIIITGMPEAHAALLGMKRAESLTAALASNPGRVALIPFAALTLPVPEGRQ